MGRTDCKLQMKWLSMRINQLKFKTSEKLRISLEETMEIDKEKPKHPNI